MPIIPQDIGFSSPQNSATAFIVTVDVASAPSVDTTLQLYCTNTSLVGANPSGAFPTSITVLAGHTSASITVKTGSPTTESSCTIAAGQPGTDMTNSANWQASKSLTIHAVSPPA